MFRKFSSEQFEQECLTCSPRLVTASETSSYYAEPNRQAYH